jgi:hypothetical protein
MTTIVDAVILAAVITAALAVLWIAWRHEARRDRRHRTP